MVGASDGPDGTIEGLVKLAQEAETKGFDDLWMANIFGLDAISTLGILGQATKNIGFGTAVTPTYPRHPSALAQQALTTGAATNGRFTLGIGLSHKIVIEDMLGLSYDKPARHMKEYLSVLMPLLNGETTTFQGEQYQLANVTLDFPGRKPVPTLVAALGPLMLNLAGKMADGTVTWMTGEKTLENHIVPGITKGADSVGKPAPQVASGFPIVLTNDPDGAKEIIAKTLQIYGVLPSYRAMLDREGLAGPADLAIVGDEAELRSRLSRLKDIGVSHFCGSIVAADEETHNRTFDFLASCA